MTNPPKCYHIKTDKPVNRTYVLLMKDSLGNLATELANSITELED